MTLLNVRCCSNPKKLMGFLSDSSEDLEKRELEDGEIAFSSEGKLICELIDNENFIPYMGEQIKQSIKNWKQMVGRNT